MNATSTQPNEVPETRIDRGPWMQTFSGVKFHLQDPRPEDVKIGDIAHHLARLCRFTGACQEFYSVAQHCVLVSDALPEAVRLQGLLHDAPEAYTGDLSKPMKQIPAMREALEEIERPIWEAIAGKFGVPVTIDPRVKIADLEAVLTERRDNLGTPPAIWEVEQRGFKPWQNVFCFPWPIDLAEEAFLEKFAILYKGGKQ